MAFYNYFYLNTVSFASSKPKVLRNVSVSSLFICDKLRIWHESCRGVVYGPD